MAMTLERAKEVLRKYSRDCDREEALRVVAEHEAKPVEPAEPAEIPAEAVVGEGTDEAVNPQQGDSPNE